MLLLALSFLYYFNYTIWDIVIPGIFTQMAILAEKWSKANILLTYLLIMAMYPNMIAILYKISCIL